jgi:hypothetical protein
MGVRREVDVLQAMSIPVSRRLAVKLMVWEGDPWRRGVRVKGLHDHTQ